ncbi:hypothetical protein [Flammeovirga sp. EKP202]|uniref:hypothetical protein n=1 Tax=Flammeovirga sp. EKP202 TaxID=2770592 RepID=UPI00165FF8BC|nr:hypothetical protein [Flammeovirga sp. EKP202]MBD0403197.1 hypothetical protein [Flammeovirga sp. EKP202]
MNNIVTVTTDNKEVRTAPERIRKERKDIFIETANNLRDHLIKYNIQVEVYNDNRGDAPKKQSVKDMHFMRADKIFTAYLGYRFANDQKVKGKSKIIEGKKYVQLDLPPMAMCKSISTKEIKTRGNYTKADYERLQRHYNRLEEAGVIVISKNEQNFWAIFLLHSIVSL